jgi:gentisate 1,2-dioxygenase
MEEIFTAPARYFEYSAAADPKDFVSRIPFGIFSSDVPIDASKGAQLIHWDLSKAVYSTTGAQATEAAGIPQNVDGEGIPPPCTSPALLASFAILPPHTRLEISDTAGSHVCYVYQGSGTLEVLGSPSNPDALVVAETVWSEGDLFTLPAITRFILKSGDRRSVLYYVNDAPLLYMLGVKPIHPTFQPTLYRAAQLKEELARLALDADWEVKRRRNRNGILLGTSATCDAGNSLVVTKTLTPTLWALYNALPARHVQPPHRHNSVALDFVVAAGPNTYTLIAEEVDEKGNLKPPITRADWKAGTAFITPPFLWHSHHNESDVDAIVLPVQDAGLHTYLRTLNIEFVPPPIHPAGAH